MVGTSNCPSTDRSSAFPPPWWTVVACPDCGAGLTLEPTSTGAPLGTVVGQDGIQASAVCTGCRRRFVRTDGAWELLPRGERKASDEVAPTRGGLRSRFVAAFYTRHNHSRAVVGALAGLLKQLHPDDWGLNLGSADHTLDPRLVNLDVRPSGQVQIVATADRLPFADNSLPLIVCQEVFEHLKRPEEAAREVARVLRPGGMFYLQTPFIMGFHSGPHDYWRFSDRGLDELLTRVGLEVIEIRAAVGAGTAIYRIAVEFWAALAATIWRKLYFPAKAAAAVACSPLRWFDPLLSRAGETNRICAGYFAIARKPRAQQEPNR